LALDAVLLARDKYGWESVEGNRMAAQADTSNRGRIRIIGLGVRFIALLVLAALLSACWLFQPDTLDRLRSGPLAIAPGQGGGQVHMDGVIHITNRCVLLDKQGEDVLLVWAVDRTTWDPTSRNITFTNRDGRQQIFSDGNQLIFEGGSSTRAQDGQTNEAWAASVSWVSPPATQCLRDARLFVDEVQIPQ
jgi:hypothetical protein